MNQWHRGAVIYQIYPRSFLDTNGDGVGDLGGVLQGLDHVAELGADGVWLSPFFKSPMADFGYDVSDYCAVDPVFGSLDDFDRVVERAHGLGLKIIIDQIYSHTSDQHAWFEQSRSSRDNDKANWYAWADAKPDGSPPNNWVSVFGGSAWRWNGAREQYYLHNFLPSQPDLNFHEPQVQGAILETAKFWLDRGVDGFRLDVANYYTHDAALRDNPPAGLRASLSRQDFRRQRHVYSCSRPENFSFIHRLRDLLNQYDGAFLVGEIFDDKPLERQIEYAQGRDRLHTAYSFHLLNAERATPKLFADALEAWMGADAWPSWSLGNHDTPRFATRFFGDNPPPQAVKLALAILFSLRGTIFVYQGEELGLVQAKIPPDRMRDPHSIRNMEGAGRDGARTPFPWRRDGPNAGFSNAEDTWLPTEPRHRDAALDTQANDPASIYQFTRQFLALRKHTPALRTGEARILHAGKSVLAFERRGGGESLTCVFNLSPRPARYPAPRQRLTRGGKLLISGLTATIQDDAVSLPAYGGAIIAAPNIGGCNDDD